MSERTSSPRTQRGPSGKTSPSATGHQLRVLRDLGASQTGEARVILGAAVIDDVLGLVILAVVTPARRFADTVMADLTAKGWQN